MDIRAEQFRIGGMTCVNCQNRIEGALRTSQGVKSACVSWETGLARVEYDADVISFDEVSDIVTALDYEVLPEEGAKPDITRLVSILVIIVGLYVILDRFGLLTLLVPSRLAQSGMGYGMLFVTGLLTSVHCIAMCGGINLSQCVPAATDENRRGIASYLPSVLYNLGRVISYMAVGFILGGIGCLAGGGSGSGVPVFVQGILKLIAGMLMVVMGVNMIGLFPALRRFTVHMPRALAAKIGARRAGNGRPFVVGLLNGLMPCGPLQSMQIVALASGSPFAGALSMLVFSLGTVPLMLGLGALVSAIGRRFSHAVMSAGAVLVVVLGLAMIAQGGNLSGLIAPDWLMFGVIAIALLGAAASLPIAKRGYKVAAMAACAAIIVGAGFGRHYLSGGSRNEKAAEAQLQDGVQIVYSTLSSGSYPSIRVREGVPVRWTIRAPEGSVNGCNYKMLIQEYGIEHTFEEGDNVIVFTPPTAGDISYSCWMGMLHGDIFVVK